MTNSFPETPALTVGVDVSGRFTSLCLLDGQGEILEEGRLRTNPEAFALRFAAIESRRVVVDVGTHSRWATNLLADIGHEVIVADPWKVRLIAASIEKRDRTGAETSVTLKWSP